MAMPFFRERDNGYNELKRRWVNHRASRGVVVGIFGEGAVQEHGKGVTNLLLALVHEFGAPAAGVPARSWLRAWIDENIEEVRRTIRALSARVLKGELEHDAALEQLGMWIVGKVRARIANKLSPPLSPATVARRLEGSGRALGADLTPLIDTGQFWQSITNEVRDR